MDHDSVRHAANLSRRRLPGVTPAFSRVTASPEAAVIEFRALGTVHLRRRDGPELLSVLSQPKRTALLAYLLLARPRGFHRRDQLVALFWPEADAEHGHNSLRQSVHFLRRSLGDEVLPSRADDELGVDSGRVWCDAQAFEAALDRGDPEAALELYGGELLPGFFVEGAPEFEHWLEGERARLRGRAVRAAGELAQACERAGDAARAAEMGARALMLAPDDEALLRAQMQRLERLGDRAAALATYESFARRLLVEYELEPDPESRRLAEEIRVGQNLSTIALAPAGAAAPPQPAPAVPPQPAPAVPPTLPAATEPPIPAAGAASALPATGAPPDEAVGPVPTQTAAARAGEPGPRRRAWPQAALAVGILLAICGIALGGWLILGRPEPALNPRRVVVAAFENQTGDATLAPLSNMAADWITQGLSAPGIVEVADAPTALTVAREAGAVTGAEAVRLFSRETGAGLVITGRYYRQADSLEFVAQIVDARTGKVVRAVGPVTAPVALPVQGAEGLRERLMAELAVLLDDRLARFQALDRQAPRYDAYREYMEGLAIYLGEDRRTAVDHFERAFALDSTFYRALLWAAQSMLTAPYETNIERYDSLLGRIERLRARLTPAEQYQLDFVRACRAGNIRAAYTAAHRRWEAAPGSDDALRELVFMAFRVYHFREANELFARINWNRGLLRSFSGSFSYVAWVQHLRGDFEGELRTAADWARREPDSPAPDELRLEALAALGRTEAVRSLASRLADRLAHDARMGGYNYDYLPFAGEIAPFQAGARQLNEHGKPAAAQALAWDGVSRCAVLAPTPTQLRPDNRLSCAELLGFVGRWRGADSILRGMNPPPVLRPLYLTDAGMAAARVGDRARGLAISDSLTRLAVQSVGDVYGQGFIEYERAMIAAALGDREDALRRLRLWRVTASWDSKDLLSSEPMFIPYFRTDPRFRKLLESED